MLLTSHLVEQEAGCIQARGCGSTRPQLHTSFSRLHLLNVPQPSKDSTTHWGLTVQTYEAVGASAIKAQLVPKNK